MTISSEILDRVPPNDLQAERALLGSLFLAPKRIDEAAAIVGAEDFSADAHRKLYGHLLAMREAHQGIDVLTVTDRLKQAGDFEAIGGSAYLAEVAQCVPVAAHAAHYSRIVKRCARSRALVVAGQQAMQDGFAGGDPKEAVARLQDQLQGIAGDAQDNGPVPAAEAALEYTTLVDDILANRRRAGLLTGLPTFDQNFGGLFPGELVILAARTSVGKTALALQIAHHAARRGHAVYYASLEMSAAELIGRLACSVSGVNSRLVRTGHLTPADRKALVEASNTIAGLPLQIHDQPGLSLFDIRTAARNLRSKDLALVVVDYLQRLTPADAKLPRYQQIGAMSDGLKRLARELSVPVLACCQLSREAEKETQPRLHHLRESGSIEQDADMVLMLHRRTNGSAEDDHQDRQADLLIEKNRNGETGALRLNWIPERTRYEDRSW